MKKVREKWERRAAGYLTAKGRSRRVEARPRPSVGCGKGLRGVVLVLGVVGTFFADNHKATGLDRMTTTEYRPGNQRIGNQRITGVQEYELLESILGLGSPSKERRVWYSGVRLGEAANPGPYTVGGSSSSTGHWVEAGHSRWVKAVGQTPCPSGLADSAGEERGKEGGRTC